ncbi:MAG: SRPBCC family protein [Thermoleophilia bacterium]
MEVQIERRVAAPPDAVFAIISDPSRREQWQSGTTDVGPVSPTPVAVGSRWSETQQGVGRVEIEVVGLEPGRLWAEAGEADAGRASVRVELAPDGDGTLLSVAVELKLRGAMRFAERALGPVVRKRTEADMDRLEELAAG